MSSQDFDVVVSGYGPAGQAVTSLLSRLGHRVCAIERFPTLYGQPRLCTIDGESARIVQAAGDVDHAFRESTWCRRYDMYGAEGDLMGSIDWSELHICGYPGRISFYQPDVEETMDATAKENGAEVLQGWEVLGFEQDDEGVTVRAKKRDLGYGEQDDELRTIRAKYLIGCDGARSFTREHLGIERRDFGFHDAFLSIDCERLTKLDPKFDVAFSTSIPGRTIAYIPIGRNRMRFEFLVDPDADHSAMLVPEIGYDFLEQAYGLTSDEVRIYRQVVYPFVGKVAETWRDGRVFLTGDAAHLMPPFLGQGACSALRDSINLAWKMGMVLDGVAPDSLLDSYELERLPHSEVLVQGSVHVGQIVCERDPVKAAERDAMYRSGNAPPPEDQPKLIDGILHRDESGEIVSPTSELMEQGIGRLNGETGRFDDLVGWGFHVIGWEVDPRDVLSAEQIEFLESIGAKLIRATSDYRVEGGWLDLDRTYEAWFTDQDMTRAVIVRPDFTVFGGVKEPEDLGAVVDDLREQLVPVAKVPESV